MKILLVNTYYAPNGKGGAERSTQVIAEYLASKKYCVEVLTSSDRDYDDTVNGVKVMYRSMGNIFWLKDSKKYNRVLRFIWHIIDSFWGNNKMMRRVLEKSRPDVVITNNLIQVGTEVWNVLAKLKIPFIHIIRDHYLLCSRSSMAKKNKVCNSQCLTCRILSTKRKRNSGYVKNVVGISEYILNRHLASGYFNNSEMKIRVPNFIDSVNGVIVKKNSARLRPVFGYMGSLNPRKGVKILIDQFVESGLENELYVYGSGDYEFVEYLKGIERQKANIVMKGYVQPREVFGDIDCLIVPSVLNEAFGRVVIEAYSYGVPVLASNKGGIPEIVSDGVTGYIFDVADRMGIYSVIVNNQLDKKIPAGMQDNCVNKAKEFSLKEVGVELEELICDIAK